MGKVINYLFKKQVSENKVRFIQISLLLFLLMMGVCGLWMINDLFGCMYMTNQFDGCGVTNGFFTSTETVKLFHIGLYMSLGSIFFLCLASLYLLSRENYDKKKAFQSNISRC